MRDLFRGLIAGGVAYKLGGGLISTIIIFVLVFWLLGKCQFSKYLSVLEREILGFALFICSTFHSYKNPTFSIFRASKTRK